MAKFSSLQEACELGELTSLPKLTDLGYLKRLEVGQEVWEFPEARTCDKFPPGFYYAPHQEVAVEVNELGQVVDILQCARPSDTAWRGKLATARCQKAGILFKEVDFVHIKVLHEHLAGDNLALVAWFTNGPGNLLNLLGGKATNMTSPLNTVIRWQPGSQAMSESLLLDLRTLRQFYQGEWTMQVGLQWLGQVGTGEVNMIIETYSAGDCLFNQYRGLWQNTGGVMLGTYTLSKVISLSGSTPSQDYLTKAVVVISEPTNGVRLKDAAFVQPLTGFKEWTQLEEYYTQTQLTTGRVKPNLPGDPDFLAPEYRPTECASLVDLTPTPTPASSGCRPEGGSLYFFVDSATLQGQENAYFISLSDACTKMNSQALAFYHYTPGYIAQLAIGQLVFSNLSPGNPCLLLGPGFYYLLTEDGQRANKVMQVGTVGQILAIDTCAVAPTPSPTAMQPCRPSGMTSYLLASGWRTLNTVTKFTSHTDACVKTNSGYILVMQTGDVSNLVAGEYFYYPQGAQNECQHLPAGFYYVFSTTNVNLYQTVELDSQGRVVSIIPCGYQPVTPTPTPTNSGAVNNVQCGQQFEVDQDVLVENCLNQQLLVANFTPKFLEPGHTSEQVQLEVSLEANFQPSYVVQSPQTTIQVSQLGASYTVYYRNKLAATPIVCSFTRPNLCAQVTPTPTPAPCRPAGPYTKYKLAGSWLSQGELVPFISHDDACIKVHSGATVLQRLAENKTLMVTGFLYQAGQNEDHCLVIPPGYYYLYNEAGTGLQKTLRVDNTGQILAIVDCEYVAPQPTPVSSACTRPTGLNRFNFFAPQVGTFTSHQQACVGWQNSSIKVPGGQVLRYELVEAETMVIGEDAYVNFSTTCERVPQGYYYVTGDQLDDTYYITVRVGPGGIILEVQTCTQVTPTPTPTRSLTPTPTSTPALSAGGPVDPCTFSESYQGAASVKVYSLVNQDQILKTVYVKWDPFDVPDYLAVLVNNVKTFETGCLGKSGRGGGQGGAPWYGKITLQANQTLTLFVDGTCARDSTTLWNLAARCEPFSEKPNQDLYEDWTTASSPPVATTITKVMVVDSGQSVSGGRILTVYVKSQASSVYIHHPLNPNFWQQLTRNTRVVGGETYDHFVVLSPAPTTTQLSGQPYRLSFKLETAETNGLLHANYDYATTSLNQPKIIWGA